MTLETRKKLFRALAPPAALALLSLAVWSSSLPNDFTNWDDNWLITGNPWIRETTAGNIAVILDPGVEPRIRMQLGGEYLPVRDLSYMLDHSLFGMNAFGFHLTNLALHIAVCLLLYSLVLHLSKSSAMAFAAALLFSVHPYHVESVAWLSSRKDLLAALFFLLGMISWNAFRRSKARGPSAALWFATFACYVLACASKYMSVTLPAALLLHDWLLMRPRPEGLKARVLKPLLETLPFFAFMVFFAKFVVIRYASKGLIRGWYGEGFGSTFLTVANAMREYIVASFVPVRLQACFDHPVTSSPDAASLLSFLFAAGIAGFGAWVLFRALFSKEDATPGSRLCAFAALFFFAAISPVSNVLFPMGTLYAERYMYLPLAGAPLLLAAAFDAGLRGAGKASGARSFLKLAAPAAAGLLLVFVAYGAKSFSYNFAWQDSGTLWSDVLEKSGGSHHTAHFNLGNHATDQAGKLGPSAGKAKLEEAERQFRLALETRHESFFYDYARVHAALGTALGLQGRLEEAVAHFDKALEINQASIEAAASAHILEGERFARSDILVNRGDAYSKMPEFENLEKAFADFKAAVDLNPRSPIAWLNLGLVQIRSAGRFGGGGEPPGVDAIEQAAALDPWFVEAPLNLGILHFNSGRFEKARACFEEALVRRPGFADAKFYIAAIHLQMREHDEARKLFEEIAAAPGSPVELRAKAWSNIALTYSLRGKYAETEKAYLDGLKAIEGAPQDTAAELKSGLAGLYAEIGASRVAQEKFDAACVWFEKAYALDPGSSGAAEGLAVSCLRYGSELAAAAVLEDRAGRREDAVPLYSRAVAAFARAAHAKPSFEAFVALGETSKKIGDLDGVLSAFENALEFQDSFVLREESMKIRIARTESLMRAGREDAAVEECRKAAAIQPSSVDPLRVLVHIFESAAERFGKEAEDQALKGEEAAGKGRTEEAAKARAAAEKAKAEKTAMLVRARNAVGEILELKPDSAPDLSHFGRLQAQTGSKLEAEDSFRKLIDREPKIAEHYVNLAVLLEGRGETGQALDLLRKGLQVNPDSTRAQEALLHTLKRSGLLAAARWRSLTKKLQGTDPDKDPVAYAGIVADARSTAQTAESLLKEYLSRLRGGKGDPSTEQVYRRTSADRLVFDALLLMDRAPEEAEELAREAMASVRLHPEALRILALLLERRGELDEAWSTLNVLLAVDPSAGDDLTELRRTLSVRLSGIKFEQGMKAAREGNHEAAVKAFDEAIGIKPGYALYHLRRASSHEALGRIPSALADFDKAAAVLESGGKAPQGLEALALAEAHLGAARLLDSMNRPAEAADRLGKAADLSKDAYLVLAHAAALEKAGMKEEAARKYGEALKQFESMTRDDPAREARRLAAAKQAAEGLERLSHRDK